MPSSEGRECVSIHIGQAGVQIGNAVLGAVTTLKTWDWPMDGHLLKKDDGMGSGESAAEDGQDISNMAANQNSKAKCQYYNTLLHREQQWHTICAARQFSFDFGAHSVLTKVRSGPYRQSFSHPEQLITGKEDAANNYARGHYTIGKEQIDRVLERVRKQAENCAGLQGFLVFHSFGGGHPGSGFSSLADGTSVGGIPARRANSSSGPNLIVNYFQSIYPAPQVATAVVEPVQLHSEQRHHTTLNEKHSCGLSRSWSTMRPFKTFGRKEHRTVEAYHEATVRLRDNSHVLRGRPIKWSNATRARGKYIKGRLFAVPWRRRAKGMWKRGDCFFREGRSVAFILWIGPSCAFVCFPIRQAIAEAWARIKTNKFDLMYAKRAFVHWYVGDGEWRRANFRRRARIWRHLRKTMRRLLRIMSRTRTT
ncbi:hypothetical protein niasHT_026925 [Heterodera trifolii]|uniref:Tubulin/FtsZ GTPase domain-containing protein n=1 Tax=Heterodera trifolii TaxID=157864 RepID=A0ABD2JXX8_9BILA